jgi:hypothetical protein
MEIHIPILNGNGVDNAAYSKRAQDIWKASGWRPLLLIKLFDVTIDCC